MTASAPPVAVRTFVSEADYEAIAAVSEASRRDHTMLIHQRPL